MYGWFKCILHKRGLSVDLYHDEDEFQVYLQTQGPDHATGEPK